MVNAQWAETPLQNSDPFRSGMPAQVALLFLIIVHWECLFRQADSGPFRIGTLERIPLFLIIVH
jgi:hypothetical protein